MKTKAWTGVWMLAAACVAGALPANGSPTKVMLFFDTEDYTCDRSNDAIRDVANILTSEGVRGNFNIVGYLATRLVELGRRDVVEALRPHVIGTQTLYHTRHPDVSELGDDPDYERSYRRTMADEARGVGMLEAVFGEGRCIFACPPGNSISPASFEVYADLNIPLNAGTGYCSFKDEKGNYNPQMLMRTDGRALGLWYFNQLQLPYFSGFGIQNHLFPREDRMYRELDKTLARLAQWDCVVLYMHPHMAVKMEHWDKPNYQKGNLVEWRKWKQVEDRPPADTAVYYEHLRDFIRRVKADSRFVFSDVDEYIKSFKPRAPITEKELPAIRASLLKDFTYVEEPGSWCVADVFQAAVRLLRGERFHRPGKAFGFLEKPQGVTAPVEVSAADLREAAKAMDVSRFLPPSVKVGGTTIGPADFLMAALDVLVTGAEKVTVRPKEQLGSFKLIRQFETYRMANTWMHTPEFKDDWLTDRLRLQLWTMRLE